MKERSKLVLEWLLKLCSNDKASSCHTAFMFSQCNRQLIQREQSHIKVKIDVNFVSPN